MDLIYGSGLWYASTKVNCHHFAERLAQSRPVLFVESMGARPPRLSEWRRLGPRLARAVWPLRRLSSNLWLYSPLPLPLYRGARLHLNSRWVGRQVRALLRLCRWRIDACWVFHPVGLGIAVAARPRALIYYCIDDYASNPGSDPSAIRALETELVQLADLTIVTGEPLARRLRPLSTRVRILPNVSDTELFGRDHSEVRHPVLDAIDRLPRPRLGYLGNLAAYKIDMELVLDIARRRPDWTIVLVGPRNQGDTRRAIREGGAPPNVFFGGEVPHHVAPAVIDRFDVGLLPSANHAVMKASFPLKFFEYLLRGRPVVSRPLPSLAPFREWYDEAITLDDFVAAIQRSLSTDSLAMSEERRAFAQAFGWPERMRQLEALRNEVLRLGASERGSLNSDGSGGNDAG
jgi:glycosyltransferase involved in cell wall biosynthesis